MRVQYLAKVEVLCPLPPSKGIFDGEAKERSFTDVTPIIGSHGSGRLRMHNPVN